MATAVYLASLGIASGLVGLWCRRLLAEFGLIHGFDAMLWAVAFVAALYIAAQTMFRAVVMLYRPTDAPSLTMTEILSQSAALLLAPSLAGFAIPLPYASLQRIEPFIHFGAFAALHAGFKIMAFFAAVQGRPASRLRSLPWALLAGAACLSGYAIVEQYLLAVQQERPLLIEAGRPVVVDNAWASAVPAPENVRVSLALEERIGNRYSLLWAAAPDSGQDPLETIYVALEAYDVSIADDAPMPQPIATLKWTLALAEEGWTTLAFDRGDLPDDTHALAVSWSSDERDSIKQRFGLQQSFDSGRSMLVSGPWQHAASTEQPAPSIVVVMIEALGAENMSLYGYHRNTTPHLNDFAVGAVVYEEAYTPTPQTAGACMSMFTGVNPLAHRYYESYAGPLPDDIGYLPELLRHNGYYTAAFTEGRGTDVDDLHHGGGFERGFIVFDDNFPVETRVDRRAEATAPARPAPAGAWITLQKAGDWIAAHADTQYMVFIRLRELRNPMHMRRYGDGFVGRGRTPDPVDIYDTAITYVDKQVSDFIERLYGLPEAERPVVAVTSSHGFDFTEPGRGAWRRGGPPRRTLHESALRIPLLLDVPGRYGGMQKNPVSLEDLGVTLAALAGVAFPHAPEGSNVLSGAGMRERISMTGDPVALSMRTGRWRFSWQSGKPPYSIEQIEAPTVIEFVDITRYRNDLAPVNNISREPRLVEAFTQQLRTFLEGYQQYTPNQSE